jgi:hypothetical protein
MLLLARRRTCMLVRRLPRLHAVLLALPVVARPLPAQLMASEPGSVSQTIDGTTMKIEYSRPVARGRDSLFGSVVHWGETWTPGANWATTFETDKDIRVNGQVLPKGKYSVWMIVQRPPGDWTVFFSRDARRWHTDRPSPGDAQIRFTVKPEQGPHMETLSWYFPVIARDAGTLRLHWGTTVVPLRVAVQPTEPDTLTVAARARYVGAYRVVWQDEGRSDTSRVEVIESQGRLRARPTPAFLHADPEFDLIPAGRHRFLPGLYREGQLFGVETDLAVVFMLEGSRARGFEVRSLGGNYILGKGERLP